MNTDGFRYLWENDGSKTVTGTPPIMGQTMRASIDLTDATNSQGVAIVIANPASGSGIIT